MGAKEEAGVKEGGKETKELEKVKETGSEEEKASEAKRESLKREGGIEVGKEMSKEKSCGSKEIQEGRESEVKGDQEPSVF